MTKVIYPSDSKLKVSVDKRARHMGYDYHIQRIYIGGRLCRKLFVILTSLPLKFRRRDVNLLHYLRRFSGAKRYNKNPTTKGFEDLYYDVI